MLQKVYVIFETVLDKKSYDSENLFVNHQPQN